MQSNLVEFNSLAYHYSIVYHIYRQVNLEGTTNR